jgi:hypothetical protein
MANITNAIFRSFNEFLSDKNLEGKSNPRLHYPGNKPGKSGATIARGFDIGQHSEAQLKGMGFTPALLKKLMPYAGKTGKEAWDLVKTTKDSLVLTSDEYWQVLSIPVISKLDTLASKFNKVSKIGDFEDLHPGLRNMIGSVYYQMGTSSPETETPDFWRQITTGDWGGMVKNMQNFRMTKKIKDKKGNISEVHWPEGDDRRRRELTKALSSGWNITVQAVMDSAAVDTFLNR